ncbi:hypothetical protein NDI49_33740, partial [Trichocoleus sp. ST-U3]
VFPRLTQALLGIVHHIAKGRRQKAFMFITNTWLFGSLKKVLTFMATAIPRAFILSRDLRGGCH